MDTGYLKVILGSMFAGKTTNLINEYNCHKACGFKCCFINHAYDDRYDSGLIKTKTHNNMEIANDFSVNLLSEIFDKELMIENINIQYDVYFINEGQFFDDLYEWVDWLVNCKNKKVFVCGLDGDYKRKKFGTILDIIPLCDDLVKIKAICHNCKKADGLFTCRLSDETEQILVGTTNYCSLCRQCYNTRQNAKNIEEDILNFNIEL
jgi:thymidine kinase